MIVLLQQYYFSAIITHYNYFQVSNLLQLALIPPQSKVLFVLNV